MTDSVALERAVRAAARANKVTPVDKAAAELAATYARQIDAEPAMVASIGPLLLAALEALGMTPRARSAVMKGAAGGPAVKPLDELRARRARKGRAADLDTAAT